MRSTFALFVLTLVLIVTGLALYSTIGIVRNSDDPKAGAAVTDFGAALKEAVQNRSGRFTIEEWPAGARPDRPRLTARRTEPGARHLDGR